MKIKRIILRLTNGNYFINLISILHQNVQSIGNAINKLNDTLINHPECQILCISEHWKNEDQLKQLGIKNFKLT